MDFAKTLREIEDRLAAREIDWAVVGGVALAMHGLQRLTLDLDIVADGERQEGVLEVLAGLGFECLHQSRGYSNHRHPDPSWGQVDVVYVRGETRREILSEPKAMVGPGGLRLPVAEPEHLVAMKAHAISNDPRRRARDLTDIRSLAEADILTSHEIREILERYDASDLLEELES